MLKITLLSTLLSLGLNCAAADSEDINPDNTVPASTVAAAATPEQPTAKRSLAAHMGMTPDEAVFSSTREMRSRYLNDMQLDENQEVVPLMPKVTPH